LTHRHILILCLHPEFAYIYEIPYGLRIAIIWWSSHKLKTSIQTIYGAQIQVNFFEEGRLLVEPTPLTNLIVTVSYTLPSSKKPGHAFVLRPNWASNSSPFDRHWWPKKNIPNPWKWGGGAVKITIHPCS